MNGLAMKTKQKTNEIKIDEDLKEILDEEIEKSDSDDESATIHKKKRGRKKKTETLQIGQTLLIPINYIFNRFAEKYKEDSFRLNEQESVEFGNAIDKVASKYIPFWLDKYNDELALAFVAFTIFYPRYNLYQKIKKEKLKTNTQEDKLETKTNE